MLICRMAVGAQGGKSQWAVVRKSSAEEEMVLNCSLNRFVKMEVIPGRGDVWAKV